MLILHLQNWISVGQQKVQGRSGPATPERRGNLDMLVRNWLSGSDNSLRGKTNCSSSLKRSETCGVDTRECFIVKDDLPIMIHSNYIIEPQKRGNALFKPRSGSFNLLQEKYS
jgi:hypothetical protein